MEVINKVVKWAYSKLRHTKSVQIKEDQIITNGKVVYSQEGEDLMLDRLMNKSNKGIYVDIGAHHPTFLSNTYYFYLKGWRGVNIDPMPGFKEKFNIVRREDINVELGISDEEMELNYFMFNMSEMNTFSCDQAKLFLQWEGVRLVKEMKIKTVRLDNLFSELNFQGDIDFFNIDVEGLEEKILKSNNWNLYSPKFIMIEQLGTDFENVKETFVYKFLFNLNYKLISKTYNTFFYCKKDFIFTH